MPASLVCLFLCYFLNRTRWRLVHLLLLSFILLLDTVRRSNRHAFHRFLGRYSAMIGGGFVDRGHTCGACAGHGGYTSPCSINIFERTGLFSDEFEALLLLYPRPTTPPCFALIGPCNISSSAHAPLACLASTPLRTSLYTALAGTDNVD